MSTVEAFDGIGVEVEPGALSQDRPVPLHAKGLEFSEYLPGGSGSSTRQVEILDAHVPLACMSARIEIAADRGYQGAKMQGSAGRRGEASAVGDHSGGKDRKGRKGRKGRKDQR